MTCKLIEVSDSFWNIRGSFRIGGLLDVGTQSSLVRLASGRFVLLDSLTLTDSVERKVRALTDDGQSIEAVINLHPFHTIHVGWTHAHFPDAAHYGTARHVEKAPQLDWEPQLVEDPAFAARYADDFELSIPAGVDFISDDQNVHFSSVLAWHAASKTLHVDDTFVYLTFPRLVRLFGPTDTVSFHPTLGKALERRQGAAQAFRDWAQDVIERWGAAENLCAAHTGALLAAGNRGAPIGERLRKALDKVDSVLNHHKKRYG